MGSCSECSRSCFQSCNGGCGSGCSGSCSTTCSTACSENCTTACSSGCSNDCKASCQMECEHNCAFYCTDTCSGTCSNACTDTCSGACSNTCSGTCNGDCNNACTAANEIAIINAIGDNLIQNHIIRAEDFIELKQGVEDELTRRGKGDKISHYSNNVASGNKILLEHITLLVNDLNDLVGSTSNFITDTPLASKMTQIAELIKTAKLQNIK